MTYADSYPAGDPDSPDPGLFSSGDPVADWADEQFFSSAQRYDEEFAGNDFGHLRPDDEANAGLERADFADDERDHRQSRVVSQRDLPRPTPANPGLPHRRIRTVSERPRLDLLDTNNLGRPERGRATPTSTPDDSGGDTEGETRGSTPEPADIRHGESGPESGGVRSGVLTGREGERDQLLVRLAKEGGLRHQVHGKATRLRKPQFGTEMFRCSINDVKFNSSGNLVVTIIIPYEDRDISLKLQDGIGMLLQVTAEGIMPIE